MQKLEVFCAVVELGGVRRAAEELFVSQPVVSAHLQSLKERIGVELFHRNGRGISLTEAGTHVHLWAREVLRGRLELESTLQNLSEGTSGSASISTTMTVGTYVLPKILIDFRHQFAGANITLSVSAVEVAMERTLAGMVDFSVIATDAVLGSDALQAELVARPPLCLVAAAGSRLVGSTTTPGELSKLAFVSPPAGRAMRRSEDLALTSIGVQNRQVAIELGSPEAMKQAVASDLGVALLWQAAVQPELASGVLRLVPIQGANLRDKLYIVRRANKRLSPLQQVLTERIRRGVEEQFGHVENSTKH
jgi:DNA-binding transcriptional LysR family regulator